jgi:hypothetical protein
MPTPIETAQAKYETLNAEVYKALAALGISEQALLTVLRVAKPTPPKAKP